MPDWMLFFQCARVIVWAMLAILIIKMMKGRVWEIRLATGLFFAFIMGAMLLVPDNPIMPDAVRMAHFVEITCSNFIFGWLVVGIIMPKQGKSRKVSAGSVV